MDLYADLPLAKGASTALDSDNKADKSNVWAKGVPSFVPAAAAAAAAPPRKPSVNTMLPAALARTSTKSPDAVSASGKSASKGISLAFRPASISRKAPTASVSNAFDRSSEQRTVMKETKSEEDPSVPPSAGLGFVAATTWTPVTVEKEATQAADPTEEDPSAVSSSHFFQASYRDEYHPSRPNSYEAFCEERAAKQKLEQVKRDLDRRQREQERETKREREQLVKDVTEGKAPSIALPVSAGRGRGMTVPAWMRKKIEETAAKGPQMAESVITRTDPEQFEDAPPTMGLGFAPAQRSESNQAPVFTRPTKPERDAFGRDVGHRTRSPDRTVRDHDQRRSRSRSRDRGRRGESRFDQIPSSSSKTSPQSGCVVLLQNMVGPGEVDDELQAEVKEECNSKYGLVKKCVVYEMRGRVVPEEAVRIFVEFHNPAHAKQAVQGLNSRFFGGRRVKATIYDEEHFARQRFDA